MQNLCSRTLQAVTEVGTSRVVGGIHFRRAVEEGALLGQRIGAYVVQNFLGAHLLAASIRHCWPGDSV